MNVELITRLDDPRLAPYLQPKDRRLAADQGRFIAEGDLIVQRLLASRVETESVLMAQRRVAEFGPSVPPGVPAYAVPDELIHEVLGFRFHAGVIAIGRRPVPRTPEQALASMLPPPQSDEPAVLLVCTQILNHENLGQIIRIASGFGVRGLLLGERSVEPFWRRSVRVSMGTIFTLPIYHSDDLRRDLLTLKTTWDMHLLGTVCDAAATPIKELQRPRRLAILIGPEDHGLPPYYTRLCDSFATIPMQHGTDSLNVAIATAIFLYELA